MSLVVKTTTNQFFANHNVPTSNGEGIFVTTYLTP